MRVRTCHQLALCWVRLWVSSAVVGQQELHACLGMLAAPQGSRPGEGPSPDLASKGSPVQGSFGPMWKGHSFAQADSTRTRGLCGLLLLTKAEL